jgi:hypothetical protein
LIKAKTKVKTTNSTKHETKRTKAVSQTESGGLSCTGSIGKKKTITRTWRKTVKSQTAWIRHDLARHD